MIIQEPTINDILCGKDKTFIRHEGNRLFRQLVLENIVEYEKANKNGKMKVTKRIVADVQNRYQSRFLLQVTDVDSGTKVWKVITDQQARDKTSHALRFALKAAHQHITNSKMTTTTSSTTNNDDVGTVQMQQNSTTISTAIDTQVMTQQQQQQQPTSAQQLIKSSAVPRTVSDSSNTNNNNNHSFYESSYYSQEERKHSVSSSSTLIGTTSSSCTCPPPPPLTTSTNSTSTSTISTSTSTSTITNSSDNRVSLMQLADVAASLFMGSKSLCWGDTSNKEDFANSTMTTKTKNTEALRHAEI